MNRICDQVKPLGVEYYAVSFAPDGTADEFFDYAHSMLPDVKAFKYLDVNEGAEPNRLASMGSHTSSARWQWNDIAKMARGEYLRSHSR